MEYGWLIGLSVASDRAMKSNQIRVAINEWVADSWSVQPVKASSASLPAPAGSRRKPAAARTLIVNRRINRPESYIMLGDLGLLR